MLRIKGFHWDDGNVIHLELGHGIKPEEAEEVFAVAPLYRKTKKGHFVVFGPTTDNRFLTIVFELKPKGIARIITGWDMDQKQKRYWRKHQKR